MEKELFDDLVRGLKEMVTYSKGELKEPVDKRTLNKNERLA
jgi:hypothetical protein